MNRKLVVLLAASLLALPAAVAYAQYPPAGGSVTVTSSNPNPGTGTTVDLPVAVLGVSAAPVANAACTAAVTAQPGTDASVSPTTFTSDAAGKATLKLTTGSKSGSVTVKVACGDVSTTVTVPVGAAPQAPSTGAGTAQIGEGGSFNFAWLLLGIPAAAVAGAFAMRVRRS